MSYRGHTTTVACLNTVDIVEERKRCDLSIRDVTHVGIHGGNTPPLLTITTTMLAAARISVARRLPTVFVARYTDGRVEGTVAQSKGFRSVPEPYVCSAANLLSL